MKKIHWFTVSNTVLTQENTLKISDADVIKQIVKVLKLQESEDIIIKTNNTAYQGTIELVSKDEIILSNVYELEQKDSYKKVSLFFCIPKKDKLELILEKCTEIGITDFYPIISDRTIKTNINFERSAKIIEEAAEQAQRIDTPTLHEIQSLEDIIKEYRPTIFDVNGSKFLKTGTEIQNFLIGPEGGFSERELQMFKDANLDIYKIGHTVLKTETAAIVISGILLS